MTAHSEATVDQAREELQRAYLLLDYGDIEQALAACGRAQQLAPTHPMPTLIEGTVRIAAGDLRGALALLKRATQRWPQEPLGHVYLAEANLLLGRRDAGQRALAQARTLDEDGQHAQLITALETLFGDLDPAQLPPPLKIAQG
jgi:predicted Zn-dependent protease